MTTKVMPSAQQPENGNEVSRNRSAFLLGLYIAIPAVDAVVEPLVQLSDMLPISKVMLLDAALSRLEEYDVRRSDYGSRGEFGSINQCARTDDSIRRKVRSMQRAFDLADVLVAGANDHGECIVELADNIPSEIGDSIASRDLIGALSELSRLPIALINLLPDRDGGWMKRRSQAVTYFEVLDDQRVVVQISQDLGPALEQFRSAFPAL